MHPFARILTIDCGKSSSKHSNNAKSGVSSRKERRRRLQNVCTINHFASLISMVDMLIYLSSDLSLLKSKCDRKCDIYICEKWMHSNTTKSFNRSVWWREWNSAAVGRSSRATKNKTRRRGHFWKQLDLHLYSFTNLRSQPSSSECTDRVSNIELTESIIYLVNRTSQALTMCYKQNKNVSIVNGIFSCSLLLVLLLSTF